AGLGPAVELFRAACWLTGGWIDRAGGEGLRYELCGGGGVPGPWYVVELRWPGDLRRGLTMPGLPFVMAGENGAAAWAPLPGTARLHDLCEEMFNPNNPLQFREGDGWEDAVRFRETIHVRGAAPVEEDVLVTRRGPVIGAAVPGLGPTTALRWVGLDSEVDAVGWLLRLGEATGW